MLGRNRQGSADLSSRDPGSRAAGDAVSAEASGHRFSAIDLRSSLSSAVRSLMAHAPHTEGPSDDVVKTVTSQIAAASDDVVDATADLLRNGSRSTIFGILAGTLVLGWIIGRSGQAPKINWAIGRAETTFAMGMPWPWPVLRAVTLVAISGAALVTVFLSALGRCIAEVGAIMLVGGNIRGCTRTMTTCSGDQPGWFPLALGLGLVLVTLTVGLSAAAFWIDRRIWLWWLPCGGGTW